MKLQIIITIHVRWPARPAEHRAGLDFSFVSFLCIKTKKRKEIRVVTFMIYALSSARAKKMSDLSNGRFIKAIIWEFFDVLPFSQKFLPLILFNNGIPDFFLALKPH